MTITCKNCNGDGEVLEPRSGNLVKCQRCKGTGKENTAEHAYFGDPLPCQFFNRIEVRCCLWKDHSGPHNFGATNSPPDLE